MKKILPKIAGILFAAFIVGMFGLVISLTFSALGRIFPDNFGNQLAGLVLFDIAALAWGLAFVYRSESTGQYAFAALGFLVGLAGTVAMVASEVMLSAQGLVTPPEWIGKALTYGFITVAVLHLVLGYAHAAASSEIDASIRLGAARAEIVNEAIQQAEMELETNRAIMGNVIRGRLVADIKRGLRLPMSTDDIEALVEDVPDIIEAKPKSQAQKTAEKVKGVPVVLWNAITGKRKRAKMPKSVTTTYEQRTQAIGPMEDDQGASPGPFRNQDEAQASQSSTGQDDPA